MLQMGNGEHQDFSTFLALYISVNNSLFPYDKEILSINHRVAIVKISISALVISLLPLRNWVEAQLQLSV